MFPRAFISQIPVIIKTVIRIGDHYLRPIKGMHIQKPVVSTTRNLALPLIIRS
jgi:hypothetical protein